MSTTTTATLKDNFMFSDMFSLPPKGSKAVSAYTQVIKITTDEESLKGSQSIIKDLEKTISNLPISQDQYDVDALKVLLNKVKQNQFTVNELFDTIDNMFDIHNNATIDDPTMMDFLTNMGKANLLYISDYITLVFDAQSAKASEGKHVFTLDGFLEFLNPPTEIIAA
jgi:hypothetical protein